MPRPLQRLRRIYEPLQPRMERNTPAGARANIARHYDLSNDLFAAFLDETMTYSCAVFEPGDSLADAQRRKYDAMCDLAGVGARRTSCSRSAPAGAAWPCTRPPPAAAGSRRSPSPASSSSWPSSASRAAGLERQVEILCCDYRHLYGRFDKIVSIEMFEAVGEEYWPEYFAVCDRLLAPGGRMALQTITMPDDRYRASRRSYTWVHKYIFPGGLIPSERAIAAGARARLAAAGVVGHRDRPPLPRHAAGLARAVPGPLRGGARPRLRRHVPPHLGVLPGLLRGGFRHGAIGDVQLVLERP